MSIFRTYTAISRIGQSIGNELQSLSVIGSPIAWLFAQSVQGAENGFTVTGGVFNYTAEIRFPETRHSATVNFQFMVKKENFLTSLIHLGIIFPPIYTGFRRFRLPKGLRQYSWLPPTPWPTRYRDHDQRLQRGVHQDQVRPDHV